MTPQVRSVNVGQREPNRANRAGVTGYGKRPVPQADLRAPGPKRGGLGSGLVGDFIGNTRHHGGDRQAVYAFAREELDRWERRLERALPDGSFAENLTIEGLDVDAARPGDRWSVGEEVLLEVTGPRIPCRTFSHRMGVRGWMRTFTEVGRTGAYLAVVTGGTVRPGDPVRVVVEADHDVLLPGSCPRTSRTGCAGVWPPRRPRLAVREQPFQPADRLLAHRCPAPAPAGGA